MAGKRRGPNTRLAVAAALLLAAATAAQTFDIAVWANDDSVERLPNLIASETHACGASAVLRISRMPPFREGGTIGTELVVETASDGAETMRWSVPVDYAPLALNGNELLVDHRGQRLWIGTNGSIRRESSTLSLPTPEAVACPRPGAHANSEYARCARIADGESGRQRLIQYEGPCT